MRPKESELRAALRLQAERIERYRQGKMTDAEFRPVRVSYGLYYELEHTSYLQRIKLPAGTLNAAQADVIAAIAEKDGRGRIHVTTRQNVQLHWIPLAKVADMYERLQRVGITTRGAAGDSVRNVTSCVHAGLWPGELFDVTPYAYATHEHFLFHPLNLTLPRKFKVAFSSCASDCVEAPVNDLGFFPQLRDGRRGFSVYVAGGLGAQPFLARPLREFVPAEDALIIVEAVLRLWNRSGERKNRKKARVKHLFQRLGATRFIAAVDELQAQIETEEGGALRAALAEIVAAFAVAPPHHPPAALSDTGGPECAHWIRTNVFAQKQEGYYGATVQLPLGEITSTQLRGVAALARDLGSGELRATTDQNLLLPWIPGDRLQECYRRLCALELGEADALHITDVVSCPGADYCSLAVSRSMEMAVALRAHVQRMNTDIEELGAFRIKISGCPNACGQHHIGDIGLTGLAVKGTDGTVHPHYSMLLGGRVGAETAAIGKRVPGRFRQEDVPRAVRAIVEGYRQHRHTGERFGDYVRRIGIGQLAESARGARE